jgi:uncharacterized protein (TIGR00269 family)
MKCRKCGNKAAINMRQHKLPLCSDHFLEWIPEQTQRFIDKYEMFDKGSQILVAVSGGKDSLALWDVLNRLGYQTQGLYIGLGIEGEAGYSYRSLGYCQSFSKSHNLRLNVIDVKERYGATIPAAADLTSRGKEKPCSVCGLTKRYVMNRFASEGGFDVLVTGHNLDDEAAVLFGNTLNWQTGYLARQGPVLKQKHNLVRKAKPFCRFYERETAAYAFLRGIDYIHDECPYAEGAKSIYYKELLNQMEMQRPSVKLSFYLSFLRAKSQMTFMPTAQDTNPQTNTCVECGQPTTAPHLCSFCRLWERVKSQPSDSTTPK